MNFENVSESVENEFIDRTDNDLNEIDFLVLKRDNLRKYVASLELDLSGELIMEIESDAFERLRVVESIDLSNNLISDIGNDLFSRNTNLKVLDFSRNCLKQIEFAIRLNSSAFVELNLSRNSIAVLQNHFVCSRSLVILNLSFNKIDTIESNAFDSIPSLSLLYLSNNNLRTLHLNVTKLTYLDANDNDLESIRVSSNAFRTLRCRNNYIRDMPSSLVFDNCLLVEFDLSNGKNDGIENVNKVTFSQTPCLRILKINVNQSFDMDCLQNLKLLNTFHLVYKGENPLIANDAAIGDYFATMNDFEHLTLIVVTCYNCYRHNLDRIGRLKTFHLECLKPIAKSAHISIESIFNGNEQIEQIFFKNLNKFSLFRAFAVSSSSQSALYSFRHLKKLSLIGLVNRTIADYLIHFKFIEYLNLSDGNITEINKNSFRQFRFLKELYIDNCKLTVIKANVFHYIFNLQILSLSNNQIRQIENGAFVALKNLQFLDLRNNPLEDLNKLTFFTLKQSHTKIYFDRV